MKAMSSSTRMLLSLVAGLAIGIGLAAAGPAWLASSIAIAEPIGNLWLDALRMTIIPLVFSLLVTGVASTATTASAGGLAARALLLFIGVMFVAGLFGEIVASGFLSLWPIPAAAAEAMRAGAAVGGSVVPGVAPLSDWLGAIIPTNPVKAAADGDMLPLVIFALILGFAVTRIQREYGKLLSDFFQALVDAMLVIVHWVIWIGPLGVFALAFVVGARAGVAAAGALAHYICLAGGGAGLADPADLSGDGDRCAIAVPAVRARRATGPGGGDQHAVVAGLACRRWWKRRVQLRIAAACHRAGAAPGRFGFPNHRPGRQPRRRALFRIPVRRRPVAVAVLTGAAIAVVMSLAAVGLPGQVSFFTSIVPICVVMGVPVGALPLLLAVETIPDIFRTIGNVTARRGRDGGGRAPCRRRLASSRRLITANRRARRNST